MFVVVVGAGHIGTHLVEYLSERGVTVVVIDKSERKCQYIADNYDAHIYVGDGTNEEVLRMAETEEADVLVAVTDDDYANAKICKLAKTKFGVPYVVVLSNSPKHKRMMEEAGADYVICPVEQTYQAFEEAVEKPHIRTVHVDRERRCKVVRVRIPLNAKVIGKRLSEIPKPEKANIGVIARGDRILVPHDYIRVHAKDYFYLVGSFEDVDEFAHILTETE